MSLQDPGLPDNRPNTPPTNGVNTVSLGKITVLNYAIDCNIFGALCYLPIFPANLIPSLISLNSGSDSPQFLKYHAVMSIIVNVAFLVVSMLLGVFQAIPVIGFLFGIVGMLFALCYVLLSLKLAVDAFRGKQTNLPVISDYARQFSR